MNEQSEATQKPFASEIFGIGLAALGVSLPLSLVAAEFITGGLLIITILRLIKGQKLQVSRWDLPVIAFLAIRLVTGILGQHDELIGKGLTYLLFALTYFITAWNPEGSDLKVWRNFVRGLVFGGAVASVFGLYQFVSGAVRVEGFHGGWTVFGSLTGAALILGLYMAAKGGLFFRKSLDVLLLTLCAAGLAVSVCRAEWAAAFIVLLPAGILFYPKYSVFLLTGILILILAVTPLRSRFLTLLDPVSNLSGREIIWQPSIDLIAERPILGHGLNSFHAIFPDELRSSLTDPGAGDWHNVYLQVAVESGLLGLAAFLWMLGTFLYLAFQRIRRAKTDHELGIAWGLFALVAFFCIAGGFGVFLVRIPVIVLVFLVLGGIRNWRAEDRKGRFPPFVKGD